MTSLGKLDGQRTHLPARAVGTIVTSVVNAFRNRLNFRLAPRQSFTAASDVLSEVPPSGPSSHVAMQMLLAIVMLRVAANPPILMVVILVSALVLVLVLVMVLAFLCVVVTRNQRRT